MIRRTLATWLPALALALVPAVGEAQVLRDLPPVDLDYVILHGDPADVVGSVQVSFAPVETSRGKRLEVKSRPQ